MIDEFVDEGVPEKEHVYGDEEADIQRALELSIKDQAERTQGPAHPVVLKEHDSGKFQPLPDVQGKGKEKRRTPTPTEPPGHAESPSLYAELGLTNSETTSNEEVPPVIKKSQPQSSLVAHDGPNLEDMDLEATDASTQHNPEQMEEEFTTTAYPNVQDNLKLPTKDQFLVEKSQEDEPEKTNTESEVQSMVTVPIHQDTSSVPLMNTPVINLLVSHPVSSTAQAPLLTSTTTVTRIGELEQHMADLVPANLALEERMDKHGSRLYKLENLDIPHQVSKVVDEIVTDAVDWAIQAPLRDRVRDFPEADMKEIIHHPRRKKKRRHDLPKTPLGSPPHQPPPPPPPTAAPSYSKTAASVEYTAWTTTNTKLKPFVHSSNDEDIGNDHIPKVNLTQDWWKPLSEEDRRATPKPAWSIPSFDLPVLMNNWASALASTYAPSPKNSLLARTGDMATLMDWYYKKQGITKLRQKDLEGPAFEIVKVFYPNVIHLQYQMEECHKLLTDKVDDAIIRYNVSKPLPLGGQLDEAAYYPDVGLEQMVPDQMWIDEECKYAIATMYSISHWWFQRQRFYIDRHTSEGDCKAVRTHMRILSVVRIEVFSLYGYDYMKKIFLCRDDFNEHIFSKRDFKYLYLSDFKDLYLLNLQGHLNHLPPKDKKILTTAVNLWTRNLVLRQRVEDFQLGIESYQTQLNLTKPQWDATGFEYKHNFIIIESPRAVTFRDKYGVQMIMRFN
ncbi:E-beta-farnesene synthase [Tanacetum coccineum]